MYVSAASPIPSFHGCHLTSSLLSIIQSYQQKVKIKKTEINIQIPQEVEEAAVTRKGARN